ncbi:MAG: M20 metallopeptidase family protein [Cyclobacteriaceae bacterium]
MVLLEKIKAASATLHDLAVAHRRHLHAHPELSFCEENTALYITEQLRSIGLEPVRIAGTGVTALIRGRMYSKSKMPVVALRADIDALPIREQNNHAYRSKNDGVMHACGHDAHTASLLVTAKILNDLSDYFSGTIKLIFQPGEEKNPGGASIMIREGILENPRPDVIIGQHVLPLMKSGRAGFRPGKYMASSDEIRLKVIGKGGHAATPELNTDPVLIASHIIVALQQVISRNAGPKQPSVLSFGKVVADGATNIVPDEVHIAGTFRAMDEKWREKGLERITAIATGLAESMGGKCEVNISRGYPVLTNDKELTSRMKCFAETYLGKEQVDDLDIALGAEDFAYYSQVVPACFYRLGTRNEQKGITSFVHTPTFDIDEDALASGPGLMAWLAVSELEQLNNKN